MVHLPGVEYPLNPANMTSNRSKLIPSLYPLSPIGTHSSCDLKSLLKFPPFPSPGHKWRLNSQCNVWIMNFCSTSDNENKNALKKGIKKYKIRNWVYHNCLDYFINFWLKNISSELLFLFHILHKIRFHTIDFFFIFGNPK